MTQNYGEMRQNTMGNRLNGKVSTPHNGNDNDKNLYGEPGERKHDGDNGDLTKK